MSRDGKDIKNISGDFDRNIGNINWSEDGKGLFFQYDDKGMTKLAYMSISGKVKDIVDENEKTLKDNAETEKRLKGEIAYFVKFKYTTRKYRNLEVTLNYPPLSDNYIKLMKQSIC